MAPVTARTPKHPAPGSTTPRPTPRPAASLREARGAVAALTLATFTAVTTEMLPVGLLPSIGRTFDVSEAVTGLLVSVYALMVAGLAVPLTVWTRRLPRKPLLLGTLVAYTASNALVAAAPAFAVVAVGRAVGGVSHALFFSLSIGYAARLVRPELTGRSMAVVTGGASAGFVLGVPLSTLLGTALGWRLAFTVLAVVCVVTVALVTTLLPDLPPAAPRSAADRTDRRPLLGVVVGTNALAYLGQYTVYTYVSVVLVATGLDEDWVGPVLLGVGAVGLVGLVFAARTLDRRPRAASIAVLATMTAAVAAVGVVMPSMPGVLAVAVPWGAATGAVAAVFQAAAVRTDAATPDLAGALVNATANVGIGGGAAIGSGVLSTLDVGALPFVGAALLAASLVVVLVARRAFPARP